jgi:hypothetical protein
VTKQLIAHESLLSITAFEHKFGILAYSIQLGRT